VKNTSIRYFVLALMTRFRSTAQLCAIAAVVFSVAFALAPYGSAQTTITVAPTSVELAVGQTQTFTATLANAQSGDAVVWTDTTGQDLFSPSGPSASGVAITWTAPSTPGTYVVTVASQLVPTATAIATVTVMATAPAECDTSAPQGICQPYTYIPVSGSNGYNTNVQNGFWNEAAAPAGSTQPIYVSGFGLGSWYAIDNFPAGETEIWTYPNSDPIYSGYANSNIDDFQYIVSSYSENMEQYLNPSTTDAEAAYDIWLNNYNNEVMIWVDQSNRGGAGYFGCNSTPAVTGIQFGGSNGVPVSLWDLDECSSGSTGEQIWLRDQAAEPGIGSATVYGIPSGSVDVLAMLEWMQNNEKCTTRRGVQTCAPYLPATSNLVQLEFGFEVASTGGQNEEFGVNGFSVSSTIPGVPVTLFIPWTPPAPITYGTALSAAQLDAGVTYGSNIAYNGNVPIAGTYSYSPALGTVPAAGTQTLSVTFTPTDTTDYATTTQTVPLTVNPAVPTIQWAAPAAITYGTALSAAQLDAVATANGNPVAGTYVYSPALGTVLPAGTQTLSVTFMPTDTTDYTTATEAVRLAVNPAVLTVMATNETQPYGVVPSLAYTLSGFVNGDTSSVVSGAPVLSTTATVTSLPGTYPILVQLGTLTAANYTFNLVGAVDTVTFTGSAPSSGSTCNGVYSGTFNGNLTVSAGQTCIFVNGKVTGNVQQSGGTLEMITSTINGNLQISGGMFTVTSGSSIKGNLQIQGIPAGPATNQVCGSTIDGNLQFQNNGAAVLIGASAPASCAGNTIQGNLQIENDTAAVSAVGNTVDGNLTVQSNSGATIVDGNTVKGNLQDESNTAPTNVFSDIVGGNLQCQNNTSITGGGDTAKGNMQGQCSTY
jgi:hypothetical protein